MGGPARVRAVGALVRDGAGRLLLVRRGQAPDRGRWSLPGGRVEPGEDDAAALRREMREETGLHVEVGALVGRVERASHGVVYDIADYACTVVAGTPAAASDAAGLRWASPAELATLPLSEGLAAALTAWRVLS